MTCLSVLLNCKYQLYADDTVIYHTDHDVNNRKVNLEKGLKKFTEWCDGNALTVNIKKSKYVLRGLKTQTRKIVDHNLLMRNSKLDRVSSYNYLGVHLDMNVTFHKYLQGCIQRANHKIYMLSKIRRYIDFYTAVTIYKTMILPVMEYGDIAYDNSDQKLLDKLQTLQNKALRICLNRQGHVPGILLHRECKIAKLEARRIAHLRMFMFKQKGHEMIVNRRDVCTRAHDALLFTMIRPNNEKYKRNIYYKGAQNLSKLGILINMMCLNLNKRNGYSTLLTINL